MAITPTGSIYKALEFDGVSSRSYGVYITGEAVFNAPERDVEMIKIPGRNGAFALDNGRFQNIEVSYPAGIFADNEEDFAEAISEFRNFLCSKRGYCRLQDEYNPDEYRLAIYKSGLEVEPAFLKAGEFTIKFECKPQRFLTSGETKQTIATSGDTITNPTLFESGPLLEVEGYGNISIGDQIITLENVYIGEVILNSGKTIKKVWSNDDVTSLTLTNLQSMNIGDDIIVPQANYTKTNQYDSDSANFLSATITSVEYMDSAAVSVTGAKSLAFNCVLSSMKFVYGTASTKPIMKALWSANQTGGQSRTGSLQVYYDYDGNDTIDVHILYAHYTSDKSLSLAIPYITGNSTIPALTDAAFIDLDIGEAWTESGGSAIPINNAVNIPAILPTLAPGSNTITFDNTITDLKITPRWWKV